MILMGFSFLGLAIAFAISNSPRYLLLKAPLILGLAFIGFLTWHSLDQDKGWAKNAIPPDKCLVYWAIEREPFELDKGGIWILCTPLKNSQLLFDKPRSQEPRLYKIPWTKPLAKSLHSVMPGLRRGHPAVFRGKRKGQHGKESGVGGAGVDLIKKRGHGKGSPGDGGNGHVGFYKLPPSIAPHKDVPQQNPTSTVHGIP